jgi:CheY-like chemotaxis protein
MMALGRPGESVQRLVAIMDCVEATLALLNPSIGKGIEIVTDLQIENTARVLMDVSHFQQSLINLVLNARDAIDSTGRITVKVHPIERGYEDWVSIEISDSGSGISEENAPFVLEPFFTTKKPGQGTGIGLAVVKSFVESTGGTVEFESSIGKGSSFRMELPLQEPASLSNGNGESGANMSELRVLLVEDHELLRPMLGDAIAADGHLVESFESADGVLDSDIVRSDEVDVLVIDVNLGDSNGVELVGAIESYLGHAVPTIYSTGNPDSVALCSLKPWQKVMRKPFEIDELLAAIQSIVREGVA